MRLVRRTKQRSYPSGWVYQLPDVEAVVKLGFDNTIKVNDLNNRFTVVQVDFRVTNLNGTAGKHTAPIKKRPEVTARLVVNESDPTTKVLRVYIFN